ncbi:MAG TPA: SDR family oxidoreductase [Anaerolineaceae bacterium]
MSKNFPLFLAVGAGSALALWSQYRKQQSASLWAYKEARRQNVRSALITGASAGIGETFAWALAREGYHLVLLARREDRLRALAGQIQRRYPVQVEILVADLGDPADVERVAARIAEMPDLDMLVNNAGFGTSGHFADIDVRPELNMIQVHVTATVRLTRAALPGMIARHHGGIINVASMAGLLPLPGNITYGSTKSYLIFFSKALQSELAGTGVRVEALCPGFTYSEFHDVARVSRSAIPGFLWMQAEPVVETAIKGLREGQVVVIPGIYYRIMAFFLRLPPVAPLARWVQEQRLTRAWQDASQAAAPGSNLPG